MSSRKTCESLHFSSCSLVYTAMCTIYNQGMPNSSIFFYLYQTMLYYYGTIWNSIYIQSFFYSHLPKSLFLCISWTVRHCSIFCESSSVGQFSSQPFYMSIMYEVQDHTKVYFTILFILLISLFVTFWEGMETHSSVQGVHFHCLGLALFLQCSNQIGCCGIFCRKSKNSEAFSSLTLLR